MSETRPRGGQRWRERETGEIVHVLIRRGPHVVYNTWRGQVWTDEEAFVRIYERIGASDVR